jgi:hypothetical protein
MTVPSMAAAGTASISEKTLGSLKKGDRDIPDRLFIAVFRPM